MIWFAVMGFLWLILFFSFVWREDRREQQTGARKHTGYAERDATWRASWTTSAMQNEMDGGQ